MLSWFRAICFCLWRGLGPCIALVQHIGQVFFPASRVVFFLAASALGLLPVLSFVLLLRSLAFLLRRNCGRRLRLGLLYDCNHMNFGSATSNRYLPAAQQNVTVSEIFISNLVSSIWWIALWPAAK